MKRIVLIFIALALVAAGSFYVYTRRTGRVPEQVVVHDQHSVSQPKPAPGAPTPAEYSLQVPFTPQAPTANWDQLHNEGCEEASAIMAAAYFSGDTRATLPPSEVEEKIKALTDWEQAHFGYYLDATAAETAQMIEGYFGLKAKVVALDEGQMKREVASGNVVIVPENGRLLGNPYYKQPGPIYHMLVVRGYTRDKIITNDPGTKHGESYIYDFKTMYDAGADWDHSVNTIDGSKKVMIVISK